MSRKSARDTAFRLFYEYATAGAFNPATMDVMRDCFDKGMNEKAWDYVKDVIERYKDSSEAVDKLIETHATGWTLTHMAKVELSVLRLGVTEIMHREDIAESITVNECVDITKRYAGKKSSKFVNGVLGAVIKARGEETDAQQ